MVTGNIRFSDEPTRVTQLVAEFLQGQSGTVISPQDGASVKLLAGADTKDDCAVYEIDGPSILVFGSDYVRGPKFALYEMGLLSNFDIGYYLVAANVSDLAAMGALPIGIVTVVRYPDELDDDSFRDIMAGIHRAATDFGTLNVGGDIGQAERIILSASALGICQKGKVLQRRGAEPGNFLCTTGPCGLLGAAVAYFTRRSDRERSLPRELETALVDSWRRPQARVAEGQLLASKPFATACQDTSDGLKATIEQLAEASNVGFEVFESSIPLDNTVREVARLLEVDPLALAMSASADFQLVFTIRPEDLEACRGEFITRGLNLYVIGQTTESALGTRLITRDGSARPLPGVAWRHQKSDISTLVTGSRDRASRA